MAVLALAVIFFSAEFDPRMVDEDFVSMTWCLMMFLQLWRTECQL